jgi:hypothetical protein
MVATVALANLADIAHDVNTVGNDIAGEVVRDRWNQRATVIVSDMDSSYFVSDSLHNVWRQGHAKLGGVPGDGNGADPSTWVIPQ